MDIPHFRIRRIFGYYTSIETLQQRGQFLIFQVIWVIFVFGGFTTGELVVKLGSMAYLLEHFSRYVSFYKPLLEITLMFFAPIFILGMNWQRFARRGKRLGNVTILGHPLQVVHDPPFAAYVRMGAISETAQWYALPYQWVGYVKSPDVLVEIEAQAVTRYVERLRMFDGEQRDYLRKDIVKSITAESPKVIKLSPEQRDLLRYARKQGWRWGAKPDILTVFGSILLFCSVAMVLLIGYIFVDAAINHNILRLLSDHDGDWGMSVVVVLFLGVGVLGRHMLRLGRRARQSLRQEPLIAEGMVTRFIIRQHEYSFAPQVVTGIRLDSGEEKILPLPWRLGSQTQEIGAKVRVTYAPETEIVTAVERI